MPEYDEGDLVRLSASFTNAAAEAVDPDSITFKTRSVAGVTSYVYGTDAEVVKDSTGAYHADISLDQKGSWWFRVESTGEGQAAEEVKVKVESAFA